MVVVVVGGSGVWPVEGMALEMANSLAVGRIMGF